MRLRFLSPISFLMLSIVQFSFGQTLTEGECGSGFLGVSYSRSTPKVSDRVWISGLGSTGKWMIDKNWEIAHWLDQRVNGKILQEPVNVIIRVRTWGVNHSKKLVIEKVTQAGFPNRFGHSVGYSVHYGQNQRIDQLNEGRTLTGDERFGFSDRNFLLPNNHGRIFGPIRGVDGVYYLAAFSRENFKIPHDHAYISFVQARNQFVRQMRKLRGVRFVGWLPMENAISMDDSHLSTGDHDGYAACLTIE